MNGPGEATPKISSIDAICADWIESILCGAGFGQAKISRFSATPIGTGQAAICCRITIEQAGRHLAMPNSLIAKFPSGDEENAFIELLAFNYLREVNFYRHLQPLLTIRTPHCYLAEASDDGVRFALVLEDLAPATQGDQIAGCNAEIANAAIIELARLHASSWQHPAIAAFDWANFRTEDSGRFAAELYRKGLPHFVDRCSAGLTEPERDLLNRIAEVEIYPSEVAEIESYCLVHNDYRLDNFLIDERGPAPVIHVVDWQTFGTGNPMWDVAYFLGGCLSPDMRRTHEQNLVRTYYDQLTGAGVAAEYGWEHCWRDYRRSTYHGLINCMAAMTHVTPTQRGDRLFAVMAERYAKQILELGADEFLD